MTTEKIISVLETTRLMFEMSLDDCDCDEDSAEAREDNEETIEAINEAIKALKRKTSTDAVSRKEALKEMQRYHDDCAKTSEYTRLGFETAMNVVRDLPPVTPQPKTGYWISWYEIIEEEWGTEHNPHCKCSECSTEVDPHTSKFINCCPVCGAKMVGYKKREEKE